MAKQKFRYDAWKHPLETYRCEIFTLEGIAEGRIQLLHLQFKVLAQHFVVDLLFSIDNQSLKRL